MFIGIYFQYQDKPEDEIVSACYEYAEAFTEQFGSLKCYDLRPAGFAQDNPPHMCEKLTCEAVEFAFSFIREKAGNLSNM